MTSRFILLDQNGVVQNVTLWDGVTPWEPPPGQTPLASEEGDIGDTFDGKNFLKPSPPPPPEKTYTESLVDLLVQKGTVTQAEADGLKATASPAASAVLPLTAKAKIDE